MNLTKIEVFQRWNGLTLREQLLAVVTIIIVLFYGFYSIVVLPLSAEKQNIQRKVIAQQEIYQYLNTLSEEVKDLRNHQQAQTDLTENAVLITRVDASSEQIKIKSAIDKIIPEGDSKLIIWLDVVSFDQLIDWLIELEKNQAISVAKISLLQDEVKAGFVKAKIELSSQNK